MNVINMVDKNDPSLFPPEPGEQNGTSQKDVGPDETLGANMDCETLHGTVKDNSQGAVKVDVGAACDTSAM